MLREREVRGLSVRGWLEQMVNFFWQLCVFPEKNTEVGGVRASQGRGLRLPEAVLEFGRVA